MFTCSWSKRKTTSIGLGASPGFFVSPDLLEFVREEPAGEFVGAETEAVSAFELEFVADAFSFLSLSGFFGTRVVTLWIGTVSTLVRDRVSISAVTDMPGRNSSL